MNWLWAVRDLLRHPVRSLLALLGIAVASALLLDMVLLSGGIERSFEKLLLSRGYQVRVSPKGTLPFDTEASFGDATATLARIRATSGVVQAGPILGASLFARQPTGLTPLVAYGIDPTAQGIYVVEEGGDLAPNDSSHVLLGAPAAKRLHAGPGDTITLVARLDRELAAGDYSAVLHCSAKHVIGIPTVAGQTLGGFLDRYRAESSLPDPILDFILALYQRRNTEPLAGHGHLDEPTISKSDAELLAVLTKAFVTY